MIAEMELASASAPNQDLAGATLKVKNLALDYPLDLSPLAEGKALTLRLPTPPAKEINAELGRGPLYMVALYQDLDANRRWDPTDPAFAATAQLLFFEPPSPETAAQWSSWSNYSNPSELLKSAKDIDPKNKQPLAAQAELELVAFGGAQELSALGGAFNKLDPRAGFVSALSLAELQDLARNFRPGPRSLDRAIRLPSSGDTWSIFTDTNISMLGESSSWTPVEIPGIQPGSFVARPLISYRRPIGAAMPAPGQFLNAQSELISGLCGPAGWGHAVLRFNAKDSSFTTGWIASRIGLFYAAALGLHNPWSWGLVQSVTQATMPAALVSPTELSELDGSSLICPLPDAGSSIDPILDAP